MNTRNILIITICVNCLLILWLHYLILSKVHNDTINIQTSIFKIKALQEQEKWFRQSNSKGLKELREEVYKNQIQKAKEIINKNYYYNDITFEWFDNELLIFYIWDLNQYIKVNTYTNTLIFIK